MKEMWDNRYRANDYAYGTEPNTFYKQTLDEHDFKEGSFHNGKAKVIRFIGRKIA